MIHAAIQNVLRWFNYEHLAEPQYSVSQKFHDLAHELVEEFQDSPHGAEVTTGLRKLLEAKDCFVRASLPRE